MNTQYEACPVNEATHARTATGEVIDGGYIFKCQGCGDTFEPEAEAPND